MSLKQELVGKRLKIYTHKHGWLPYDSTKGYENTEREVRFFMLNPESESPRISVSKGIHTHILGVEVHRGCVVCYVNQTNLESETTRYLVFGITTDTGYRVGVDRDSDSVIRTTLGSVEINKYYKSENGRRRIVKHL